MPIGARTAPPRSATPACSTGSTTSSSSTTRSRRGSAPSTGGDNARWLWRRHIDTSTPDGEVWSFVREWLPEYDAAVFTMREFVPPDLPIGGSR
jgi:hypothetical protein